MTRTIALVLAIAVTSALAGFALSTAVEGQPAVPAIPRTADGRPNLAGIWQAMNAAAWDIQDHAAAKGVPAGQGVVVGSEIPYQPWALAKKQENYAHRDAADPESKCYLPGVPRITYMPYPFEIVQTPTQLAVLYEYVHAMRNIYIGSQHPPGPIEWWMGDSRARWEGDTLVVDVVHFNADTWFDRAGNFHSEDLHVIERYTPIDRDHLRYDVTVEDPKVFTRPWSLTMPLYRRQDAHAQVLEYECYAFDDEFHVSVPTE